ncbi:MAG: NUDIX domain-containing protein [Syntrophomonadales bacterium]
MIKIKMKYCPQCGHRLAHTRIEDREYLACESETCNYVFWDNPLPVVAALVEYDGNVLLARNKAWPPKMYGLITGFLEKKESPEEAVLREVKEELGLDGEIVELIGLYPFYESNQLIIAYHVRAEGEIVMGEELEEIKVVPPTKLKPWAFGTGFAVREWLKKRGIER